MPSNQKQIFISHARSDVSILRLIKERILNAFDNNVEVFETSLGDGPEAGRDWFEVIRKTIQRTDIALLILTPRSIERKWVWLEIGAFWEASREDRLWMVPLLVGLTPEQLPDPINRLQAVNLTDENQAREFWLALRNRVGLPNAKNIHYKKLTEALDETNSNLVKQEQTPVLTDIERYKTELMRGLQMSIDSGQLPFTALSLFEELGLITGQDRRSLRRPLR
jgi:hypothetical protein